MKSFLLSFQYALSGLIFTLKNERNMRIHFCFAFYVIVFGFISGISQMQWIDVLLCIAVVTSLELVNTSVETVCNKFHPGKSEMIKLAKDAAAGAVLMSAAVSAVVGGLIFFRQDKVTAVFDYIYRNPFLDVVLALTVPLWITYIVGRRKNDK